VHRDDARQTLANLVLGLGTLTTNPNGPRPTQLEYAVEMRPTLTIVELGYAEVLRAALSGDTSGLNVGEWAASFTQLIRALRECGSEVVAATVSDPADTAACLSLDAAARALRVAVAELQRRYRLDRMDCLTIAGLTRAAFHILGGAGGGLQPGDVVGAGHHRTISDLVARLNGAIVDTVRRYNAHVLDLHALFGLVRERGLTIANRVVTADFLGGFYTLNGAYPGATGHAVIANALIAGLNDAFRAQFEYIAVETVGRVDQVVDYRAPGGAERPVPPPSPAVPAIPPAAIGPRQTSPSIVHRQPLRLPPSLEMTVPLSHAASYHGDAIRVVNCSAEADAQFGSSAEVLFGGPVLFDSHLTGALHIRFSPPENGLSRFEMRFDPLAGDDGVLSAPMFFRWPVQQCLVILEPNAVSAGTLNLATGDVTDLSVSVRYLNTALQALVGVNPGFPDQPIVFPGRYGSAWAKFEQRDDETLDFTFYGSTFLPLGARFGDNEVRWALPFAGSPFDFASIPARGLALHPHLQLSTREPQRDHELDSDSEPLNLTSNSLCELTLFTRRSSFGDRFSLNTPELGGPATGRSHLLGRLLLQTGERFGDSMPVVMWLMTPGGLLGQQPPPALATLFPGRLSPGPVGHDEHLRFPTRNYYLDAVTLVDDPFEFCVGAVDLRSGHFINQPMHRGFIGQDLFFSLIRVEPRTPRESFQFRGPAVLRHGVRGELVFRQRAIVRVPYPAGFAFPAPDLTSAITVGENSVLDPYLWLRATSERAPETAIVLGRENLRSSTGEDFSFRLEVREGRHEPLGFEYTNHAQRGSYRMETVSWFGRSRVLTPAGESDVYTFSGFGRWSKDGTGRAHQVAAQIAVGAEEYVSVQIDSGLVSNVNTRPVEEAAALP
jgi:hypothetical protein